MMRTPCGKYGKTWFKRHLPTLLRGAMFAAGWVGLVANVANDFGAGPAVVLGVFLAMAGFGASIPRGFL